MIATCLLARAVRTQQLRWTVASGILFGISANFRSDFLPILVALPVETFIFSPQTVLANRKHLLLVIALAVGLLVPWGLFRVHHGKPFGITATNAGMVLYNSLGYTGNAWGIVAS